MRKKSSRKIVLLLQRQCHERKTREDNYSRLKGDKEFKCNVRLASLNKNAGKDLQRDNCKYEYGALQNISKL
jgi:hypothetical protein